MLLLLQNPVINSILCFMALCMSRAAVVLKELLAHGGIACLRYAAAQYDFETLRSALIAASIA